MCICNRKEDRKICKSCFHGKEHERVKDELHTDACGRNGRKCIDSEVQIIKVKCIDVK